MSNPSPTLAIDYAWQHPSPQAIVNAGYHDVWRYLSNDPSKDITAPEADSLLAVGLGLGGLYETTGSEALGGASAGNANGASAVQKWKAVGAPAGSPLLANLVDVPLPTVAQTPLIIGYYVAFAAQVRAAGYAPGGYGTSWIINQLVASGDTGIWWQNAENHNGVPGDVVNANASVYQRTAITRPPIAGAAGSYDEDVNLVATIPYWTSAGTPPPFNPPVTPPATAPPFPFAPNGYLGMPSPDPDCHSGFYSMTDRTVVLEWQTQMAHRGWGITKDGLFYTQSDKICRQFQAEKGLSVDGKVGVHTWNATWTTPVT
jgi:Rv2525c-like, glycoside hydrolase-like domain